MKKRKQRSRWIKWAVLLVVLAIVGVFAWPTIQQMIGGQSMGGTARTGNMGASTTSSSSVTAGSYSTVSRGDMHITVYGSGSLSSASTQNVYSGAAGKIEQVSAQVGDSVKAGDTILRLSSDDLETSIATLESELFSAQVALSEIRDSGNDYYIYAPSAGRLKIIDVEEDDDIAMVMKTTGQLAVISRDDKMRVEFEPSGLAATLQVGDTVSVWVDNEAVTGVVDQISGLGGNIAVTLEDDEYEVGAEALVTTPQGEKLGAGVLEINMPIPITGVGGTIETIYYDEEDSVASGAKLFYITGRIPSAELQQALLTYNEAKVALDNAKKKQDSLLIKAPMDGVITSMDISEGASLEENSLAFTIQSNESYKVVATVDELDIVDVAVGQTVEIELDAYPDQAFSGTVTRISGVGTVSGGVATYEVTVLLDEAQGLMDGMTASVEVVVADKQNVLLVPVEAVSTAGGQNYVTLADGSTSNVTIGMSDDTNVEIISGVSEGDQVLITRDSSDDGSASRFGGMGSGGGMPNMSGGGMPNMGGGGMPGSR